MRHKKQSKKWIAVFLTCAMLFTLSGVAEAWDVSGNLNGITAKNYTIYGGINAGAGFVISTDRQTWKRFLSIQEVFDVYDSYNLYGVPQPAPTDQIYPFNGVLDTVSFDPNVLYQNGNHIATLFGGQPDEMYACLPETISVPNASNGSSMDANTVGGGRVRYGVFYMQRDIWMAYADRQLNDPMQTLFFGTHFMDHMNSGLHILLDLRQLKDALIWSDPSGSPPASAMPDWLLLGEPYSPLSAVSGVGGASGTWTDLNGDTICTPEEIQSGLTIGAQVQPCSMQTSIHSVRCTDIPANYVIQIPVLMWKEGQSTDNSPSSTDLNADMDFWFHDPNYVMPPLEAGMCRTSAGMVHYGVTGISGSDLQAWTYGGNTAPDIMPHTLLQLQQDSGFMMEGSTRTLFLPTNIDGRVVSAVDYGILEDGTYPQGMINTIVVPDSVIALTGGYANSFGYPSLQRLHLPTGIQFDDLFIDTSTTVCTSEDDPVLRQYCQAHGIPYEVCAGHIPMHTHVFDNVVVTPPTYHAAGYTTYTCSGCGGSYQTGGSAALDVPALTLQGGSAEPGDTVDVTVALTDNSGLDAITLMPQYDPQTLTLEAVSAASQDWTAAIVPGANGALPTVTVTPDTTFSGTTLCTLTFRAAADAAEGQQTVGMTATLTPPAAHVDGTPVTLPAAQTNVSILPPTAAPALEMTAGSGTPGSLVSVTVNLRDNPGVIAMLLEADYDTNALELADVINGTVFGAENMEAGGDHTTAPYRVCWSDSTPQTQNYTADGELVTFRFRILPGASQGNHAVTVSLVPGSTFNSDLDDVSFTACTAQVAVNALRGDANGDGVIDMRDAVVILHSLRDPQQTVAPINADVNGDGVVDRADALLIRKYVVRGHGVTLP